MSVPRLTWQSRSACTCVVFVNRRSVMSCMLDMSVCWFFFQMICLRSKQSAIDLCVCECVCVCIMVMSRNVDFHVRQQRSLLTPLLPILWLFVYVCLCVCLSVAAISRPEQFLYSSFWLFLFFQAYGCLIVPLPELADINTHKQWTGKWNTKNPPPHNFASGLCTVTRELQKLPN